MESACERGLETSGSISHGVIIIIIIIIIITITVFIEIEMASHLAIMEVGRRAFKILTGSPKGKIPLGRPVRRWE